MRRSSSVHNEIAFHNIQAESRRSVLDTRALTFADADYLDHESWIRPAFAMLGEVRGNDILDYGCGHGMAAVVLARSGANVTAMDLSDGYVAETQRRALANGVRLQCLQADAHRLPFENASFDAVWGNAVLHHMELGRACAELRRVLRPGGRAVFCEPFGNNPLLELARRYLPYPGKSRTPEECPLRQKDVVVLRSYFSIVEVRGFQLVSMLTRLFGTSKRRWKRMEALESRCLHRFPSLTNLCRYVAIRLGG